MRVSVVVVAYNAQTTIRETISSLQAQSFKDYEIIVVDNNSHDNTVSIVRELFTTENSECCKLICNSINTGFTGGNITGFKHADGEYIALLNADAEAESTWLQSLVDTMDSQKKIGICASKIINYSSHVIDSAGDGFSRSLQGFKRGEGELEEKYIECEYVFGACAGAALYRKEMLEEIGFFDEDFFLIHEDTDMNFRAQLQGWKIFYVPNAVVHHKVRSSIGHMSDLAIYYSIRNKTFVWIKNIPASILLRYLPQLAIGIIAEFIYFALRHKKISLYFRAKKDVIKMLPGMIKKRTLILKKQRVSNGYLMSIMTPLREKGFIRSKMKKILYG